MAREVRVQIFDSFEQENEAEYERRAKMSREECLREFEAIQERLYGESWRSGPIVKVATWETVDW